MKLSATKMSVGFIWVRNSQFNPPIMRHAHPKPQLLYVFYLLCTSVPGRAVSAPENILNWSNVVE